VPNLKTIARNAARSLLTHLRWRRYDNEHRRDAELAYDNVVKQNPERRLDQKTSTRIEEYAIEKLGSARFVPWLRTYVAFRGKYSDGLMPDNYFGRFVVPFSMGTYVNIESKTLSRRILKTDQLPDLAYYVNGTWMDTYGNQVSEQNIRTLLFSKSSAAFVKQDLSYRGLGVFKITSDRFDLRKIESLGNLVIQAEIQQHSSLSKIVSGSVATVRITTVKVNGFPAEQRAAYLRLARSTETLVSSKSALQVPIVDKAGTLGDYALFPDWSICRSHPDSGFKFEGAAITNFTGAVSLCTKLHNSLPHIMIIGWDVAIGAGGEPVLMEWNADHPAIKFTEAAIGPCFLGLGWESLHLSPSR
jgi:hypothetical protein